MEDIIHSSSESESIDSRQSQKLKCKFCFRHLSSRQSLREHLYIHTGERPYVCPEPGCGQTFRQGSLLSIHRKIHLECVKNKSNFKNTREKSTFPKLTDLITIELRNDKKIEEFDREIMKATIGKDFDFVKKFLNSV